jgi:hypothetical protein
MLDPIGFIVVSCVRGESGRFHAIGRCGDRAIRIGDTFTSIYLPDRADEIVSPGPDTRTEVRLHIVGVQAYQKMLSVLGEGMTGTIDLEGPDVNLVAPGAVLGDIEKPARATTTSTSESQV